MSEARICGHKQLIVGHSATLVGHCVNVRNLGKLAFFTLRSQTLSLQIVCTTRSMIEELQCIEEYALVEVTGTVQQKHSRHDRNTIEHELNAQTLRRVRIDVDSPSALTNDRSAAQATFECIERVMRKAQLIEAARRVLREREITEVPPTHPVSLLDLQGVASLVQEYVSATSEQRCCLHPPFHRYSRFLAAGGLHRFAFFSTAPTGHQLLHAVVCQPDAGEVRAILDDLAEVVEARSEDNLRSHGHPAKSAAKSSANATLTFRDQQLSAGFGLAERRTTYLNGTAIAHCCTLVQDRSETEAAAAALGGTRQACATWLRIFRAGVSQPIPRMSMFTLVLDNSSCEVAPSGGTQVKPVELGRELDPCIGPQNVIGRSGVYVAHLAEAEQLRVELEILRGRGSDMGQLSSPVTIEDALQAIEHVLPSYGVSSRLAHTLLGICRQIHPRWHVERPVTLFQILWTLLGSTSVKSLLADTSFVKEGVQRMIGTRIISDKMQLLYVYPSALPAMDVLLSGCAGEERDALIVKLRTLMAQRPTLFSTAVTTLAANPVAGHESTRRIFESLLPSIELGIATPLLSGLTSRALDDSERLRLILALSKTGEKVFPNEALQLEEVAAVFFNACPFDIAVTLRNAESFTSQELSREILYYLYRPVTMDYTMFCDRLSQLVDRTQDWANWGIRGHGEFWNATLGCYEYWWTRGAGRFGKMRLYASKNVGSFFAKSAAGICTDGNVALFNRPDHYHLNIIDADDGRVGGNVQLYVGESVSGRFMMVRGINPSLGFCGNGSVDELVRCVLHAVCDMAAFGGFSEVRLCEQNGLWNSDSSRAEVRACLKAMYGARPLKPMEEGFRLYDYHGRAIIVSAYYRIWDSGTGLSAFSTSTERTTE